MYGRHAFFLFYKNSCAVQFTFNILMIFVSVSLLRKDKIAMRNVNLEDYLTVFHVKAVVVDPLVIILQGSWQCIFLKEVSSDICIVTSYLYKLCLWGGKILYTWDPLNCKTGINKHHDKSSIEEEEGNWKENGRSVVQKMSCKKFCIWNANNSLKVLVPAFKSYTFSLFFWGKGYLCFLIYIFFYTIQLHCG